MSPPTRSELVDAIEAATSAAVKELFATHPNDHFYYCQPVSRRSRRAWQPGVVLRRFALWQAGYDFRMSAMEEAMARLDRAGLFGIGAQRASIMINVEVMPPDHTNAERAMRLNPPEALTVWLKEVAEDF